MPAPTGPASRSQSLRDILLSPYLILLLPPLFWAGNAVAGRLAVADMSPFALAFWRWALALAFLLPFTLASTLAAWPAIRARLGKIFILGALSVGGYNTFLYMALQTTEAINATLVGAVMPLMIMALSLLILREPLGRWRMLGLVASFAGVALVIARGDMVVLMALELRQGDILMLAAVLCWALFSVLLRLWPLGLSAPVLLTAQMTTGLLVVGVVYAGDVATGGGAVPLTWEAGGIILYTALLPAIGAYFAWNYGVAAVGANIAGFYTNLVPLFTAVLAAVLLGEAVRWFHGVGLGLIFLGIALATIGGRASKGRGAKARP